MKRHTAQITLWYQRTLTMLTIFSMAPLLFGQSADSLEQALTKTPLSVTEKIKLHKGLATLYRNDNPSRSLTLSIEGLKLSKSVGDKSSEAFFCYRLATAYYRKGIPDSVTNYLDIAMSLAQEAEGREFYISTHQLYGQHLRKHGNYSGALEHYLEASKIAEQINDKLELSAIYTGIGGTYQLMKNYDQALAYYEKAEKIALPHDYKAKLADIYISTADIYARIKSDKEAGLDYSKKALSISRELQNTFSEVEALQTMVTIHYFFDDYRNALLYADSAIRLMEILDAPDLSAYSFIMASNIHHDLKNYDQCIDNARKALEADSTNVNLKLNIYSNIAIAYAYLDQPDSTHKYLDNYTNTMASYSNDVYQNSLSEM